MGEVRKWSALSGITGRRTAWSLVLLILPYNWYCAQSDHSYTQGNPRDQLPEYCNSIVPESFLSHFKFFGNDNIKPCFPQAMPGTLNEVGFAEQSWQTFIALNWPAEKVKRKYEPYLPRGKGACRAKESIYACALRRLEKKPLYPTMWQTWWNPFDFMESDRAGYLPSIAGKPKKSELSRRSRRPLTEKARIEFRKAIDKLAREVKFTKGDETPESNLAVARYGDPVVIHRASSPVLTKVEIGESGTNNAGRVPLFDAKRQPLYYQIMFNDRAYEYIINNGLHRRDGQRIFFMNPNNSVRFPHRGSDKPGGSGRSSMMIKAAWMNVGSLEHLVVPGSFQGKQVPDLLELSRSFHLAKACLIGDAPKRPGSICSKHILVALVGLHVAYKDQQTGLWQWATFEHILNAPENSKHGDDGYNPTSLRDICGKSVYASQFKQRKWNLFQQEVARTWPTNKACPPKYQIHTVGCGMKVDHKELRGHCIAGTNGPEFIVNGIPSCAETKNCKTAKAGRNPTTLVRMTSCWNEEGKKRDMVHRDNSGIVKGHFCPGKWRNETARRRWFASRWRYYTLNGTQWFQKDYAQPNCDLRGTQNYAPSDTDPPMQLNNCWLANSTMEPYIQTQSNCHACHNQHAWTKHKTATGEIKRSKTDEVFSIGFRKIRGSRESQKNQ